VWPKGIGCTVFTWSCRVRHRHAHHQARCQHHIVMELVEGEDGCSCDAVTDVHDEGVNFRRGESY
jgi:hypothetical protein